MEKLRRIHLLTSNSMKVETARLVMDKFDIEVIPISVNIPEIQADTNAEIARVAALEAAKILNVPIIREDHGFFFNTIPNFPGPFMAYIESTIPPELVLDLLANQKDRTAFFVMALAYAKPDGELVEFIDRVPCHIAKEVRPGSKDFGWDNIICFQDDDRALSEFPVQERYKLFTKNFIGLAKYLKNEAK